MRTEPPRQIVSGNVASAGTVVNGTGFIVTKTGAGSYLLRFTPPLRSAPALSMAPTATNGFISLGGVPDRYSAQVYTYNAASGLADIAFSFEAVA